MKYILSSAQMKQCDVNTMEKYGMVSAVLMERAAMSVVEEIVSGKPGRDTEILIACGTGNNGGDGIAMARLLYLKGYHVTILFPGKEEKCSVEAKRQLDIARRYGINIENQLPEREYDVVADALFGIGLDREIGGIYAPLIEQLNALQAWKVAVDIASGISADNGTVMGSAFKADLTVTFGFAKVGQLLYPGAAYTGRLLVKDIGIDEKSLSDIRPKVKMYDGDDLSRLPKRDAYSNKGSYGKVLIFAGSRNMAGAAAFSGKAAYRTGAGLVKIVTEESNREIIQSLVPEAVLSTYDSDTDMAAFVKEQLAWADAVIAGPGIGRSAQAEVLVRSVLTLSEAPCLLDADALNILSEHPDWLLRKNADVVVTPHLGEMSRLTGNSIKEIRENLFSIAQKFSDEYDVITVLKDARTVIASPGGESFINTTGNHGMATGGSGDVLTGMIGALLGQKVLAEQAAALGVMLHGMAGDAAAQVVGKTSLMASDLINGISTILKLNEAS